MRFTNRTTRSAALPNVEGHELRQLPQFFRSSLEYVYRLGGPLYRAILDRAPLGGRRRFTSVDSRVHMLMPGMWPCIPGWHCDDFYRPTGGQPDLRAIARDASLNAEHHALFLGDTAPTEFAAEPLELDDAILASPRLYEVCNRLIEGALVQTTRARPGEFVSFDSLVWHRGTRAERAGWRLFVRISESDHYEPVNELRTQTQVYLTDAGAGW